MGTVRVHLLFMTMIYDALHKALDLLGIVIDLDNTTKSIFIKEYFTVSSPPVRNISDVLLNVKQTTCVYHRDNPTLLVNFVAKCKYSQSPSLLDLNTVPSTVVLTYYLHIIYRKQYMSSSLLEPYLSVHRDCDCIPRIYK